MMGSTGTRTRSGMFVALAFALVALPLAPAQGATRAVTLDSLLNRAMLSNTTPGISVAVVQGDQVIWRAARGWADREARRAVSPATQFYIASTTKALTATAAASMAARGALDLEAPLSLALPGARFHSSVHAESIRVADLLTHTHGIDADGPVSVRVAYTGDYEYATCTVHSRASLPRAPGGRTSTRTWATTSPASSWTRATKAAGRASSSARSRGRSA